MRIPYYISPPLLTPPSGICNSWWRAEMTHGDFVKKLTSRLNRDVSTEGIVHTMPRQAAVLMLLVGTPPQVSVLLTVRSQHLSAHAGQVSFPGGIFEPGDRTLARTAIRETFEELGFAIDSVCGRLPKMMTHTGFEITTFVGAVEMAPQLTLNSAEVAATFWVPLDFLLDIVNHQYAVLVCTSQPAEAPPATSDQAVVVENGQSAKVGVIPQNTHHVYLIRYQDCLIWGASALLIRYLRAAMCQCVD